MLSASKGAPAPLSISAQTTIKKHLPKLLSKHFIQQQKYIKSTEEVGCLTELCSGEHLTEVEIFSLLQEQIPKYKIRSDLLTDFSGYSNRDWYIPVPALTVTAEGLGLTKDQTRETLNYFLLCGNRVSQMTRAYNDIEAVTRLLEEKEKDLELTVQIGKELLTENNTLEIKISNLEADIRACNEDRTQLLHELNKKIELIGVLTNDDECCDNETFTPSKSISCDLLQKKVAFLQDENKSLKVEAFQLACKTDEVEQLERKLMSDITTQLNEANSQNDNLFSEIEQQREEICLLQEKIVSLTASLAEAEKRLHKITIDNEEQRILLDITKENQNSLALELTEFKQRYEEVFLLLQETQEQLRKNRKKFMPNARTSFLPTISLGHPESLHSELMESSLYSQNSLDSGFAGYICQQIENSGNLISNTDTVCVDGSSKLFGFTDAMGGTTPQIKKIFKTLRSANKNINRDNGTTAISQIGEMSVTNSSKPRISSIPFLSRMISVNSANRHLGDLLHRNSMYELNNKKALSFDSLASHLDRSPSQLSGVPGAPGAKDLEAALKCLSSAEVFAKRAMLSYEPGDTFDEYFNSFEEPAGVRTPDSIMSTGSSGISSSTNVSSPINQWRLPDKLKIVKPIEGSQTLNHWIQLATPTLSSLLEERPGVTIRGSRGLDELGIQIYTLSDLEEDIEDHPGKQFEPSGCIYTYTTSIVMHPGDEFLNHSSLLSRSQVSSNLGSASTSRQTSCSSTPTAVLSRRNSCSTFSVNVGLAAMLNERGIKAVTPSALNTPVGVNYSPTVTPCNSPDEISMSLEPIHKRVSSGAHCIKSQFGSFIEQPNQSQQTQQQIILSRLEKRALNSLKLVEKVESIGLQNIISSPSNQLSFGFACSSPKRIIQLATLNSTSNAIIDEVHFDRDQIKGLLSRGLTISGSKYKSDTTNFVKNKFHLKEDSFTNANKAIDLKKLHRTQHWSQPHSSLRKHISRQKVRKELKNSIAMQRPDLGTIVSLVGKDVGESPKIKNELCVQTESKVEFKHHEDQSTTQSFVGSVSSLLFGRKGGWF